MPNPNTEGETVLQPHSNKAVLLKIPSSADELKQFFKDERTKTLAQM